MTEVIDSYEHAGLLVEFVQDDDGEASDPASNDNAGTIYSWEGYFDGDERIAEPDLRILCDRCDGEGCSDDDGDGWLTIELAQYMRTNYDAALTLPLRFADYGSRGSRIDICDADSANAALCFTQKEIDYEWSGHLDPHHVKMKGADGSFTGEVREYGGARSYAEARIAELDNWLQGYVVGIVIREHEGGGVLESVWGFIANPFARGDREYLVSEANAMAEGCADEIAREADEAHRWACADVLTV